MMHSLVRWIGRRCLRWFYREQRLLGFERIPREGPVVLIGNHGNDLPDVICGFLVTPRPLRYLASISGATSAISQAAYRGLGVIPVMRVRDVRTMREQGHDGAAMNRDAFRLVSEALRDGDIVGAFPEGGVHDAPRLGHFRAGVAQMVLNCFYNGAQTEILIVPFGIQYEAARSWRSDLSVVVGEPISLGSWLAEQEEMGHRGSHDGLTADAAVAQESRPRAKLALRLRDRMHGALTALTRNAPNWESAERRDALVAAVSGVLASRTDDVSVVAVNVQHSCAKLVEQSASDSASDAPSEVVSDATSSSALVLELAAQVTRAVVRAGAMPTSARDVARVLSAAGTRGVRPDWPSWIATFVATPLAAIGWLVHGPAFFVIWRSARRTARDRTEYVARAFVPGLYLILCAYVLAGGLLAALLMLTSWSSWWAIAFVMLLPRLGDVAVWWRDSVRALRLRARVTRWSASDRTALCLAADALRVAWHSHLASTVVHSAGHSVGDPVVPALTNVVHAVADHVIASGDAHAATNISSDAQPSSSRTSASRASS